MSRTPPAMTVRSPRRGFMRPTLAHVAKAAGVAPSTVSDVLSNRPGCYASAATRQQIIECSKRLGYRPNAQARTLRTACTRLVGVACGPPTDTYEAAITACLEKELHSRGYQMLLHTMVGTAEEAWERALNFVDHRACGIILETPLADLHAKLTAAFPSMFASVILGAPTPGASSVTYDYDLIGRQVAKHLLSLGRKRWATNVTMTQYAAGIRMKTREFSRLAIEAGLPAPIEVAIEGEHFDSHFGHMGQATAKAIMEKHPDVDAIYFSCDDVALGAMSWLLRAGYRVPQDVALIGFNGSPITEVAPIPLTTVRLPIEEYAQAAVEMLVRQLEQGDAHQPQTRLLNAELVIRRSSDPAAPLVPESFPIPTKHFGP